MNPTDEQIRELARKIYIEEVCDGANFDTPDFDDAPSVIVRGCLNDAERLSWKPNETYV